MHADVICDRTLRLQRRGQHKGQLVLPNDVADAIFQARFRPGISKALETERGLVKMRGLLGISDVELNVIGSLQGKKIAFGQRGFFWGSNGCFHNEKFVGESMDGRQRTFPTRGQL